MPAIRLTRRFLSAYADTEGWKRDHDEAQSCLDVEEQLDWGIHLFRVLLDLEARTQDRAIKRPSAEAEQLLELMPTLYQLWTQASERYLERAVEFQEKGYVIGRVDEFRGVVEEARCLLGNLELEDQIRPIEELIRDAKPENPAPGRYQD